MDFNEFSGKAVHVQEKVNSILVLIWIPERL